MACRMYPYILPQQEFESGWQIRVIFKIWIQIRFYFILMSLESESKIFTKRN